MVHFSGFGDVTDVEKHGGIAIAYRNLIGLSVCKTATAGDAEVSSNRHDAVGRQRSGSCCYRGGMSCDSSC